MTESMDAEEPFLPMEWNDLLFQVGETDLIYCNDCGQETRHVLRHVHHYQHERFGGVPGTAPKHHVLLLDRWAIWQCLGCEITLRHIQNLRTMQADQMIG